MKLVSVAIAELSAQRSHELRRQIEGEADIRVIAEADTPHQLLSVVFDQSPDLLILSAGLLPTGGLDAIELIMAERPTGILIIEDYAATVDDVCVQKALQRGALHREPLPSRSDPEGVAQLRTLIRRLARVPVVRHILSRSGGGSSTTLRERIETRVRAPDTSARTPPPRRVDPTASPSGKPLAQLARRSSARPALIALGASIGGPNVLADILRPLPTSLCAALVLVQHLPAGFAEPFADYLRSHIALPVHVVRQAQTLQRGCVYLAADDHHVITPTRGTVVSDSGPLTSGHRPSVDRLFVSVAQAYGETAVGVLLTGLGQDGSQGLMTMRQGGALTIAQDADSSTVDGMPKAARESGAAEYWLPPADISSALLLLCQAEAPGTAGGSTNGGGGR